MNLGSMMAYSILGPFFPKEAENKGASNTMIGVIFGCYALFEFLASLVFGKYVSIEVHVNTFTLKNHVASFPCLVIYNFPGFRNKHHYCFTNEATVKQRLLGVIGLDCPCL